MYIFFLVTLFLFFIYAILNKKLNLGLTKIATVLFFLLLTFMAGYRDGVGKDYSSYEEWFLLLDLDFSKEWFHSGLMYLVNLLNGEFYWITLTYAILTNFFIYKGLKGWGLKNEYLFLAILLFCANHYLLYFNLMRQGLAIAIVFYSVRYIFNNNFKKYLFFIFLASCVHLSAIFFVIFYWLRNIKLNLKKYLLSVFILYFTVYIGLAPEILNFIVQFTPYAEKYSNTHYILENQSTDINLYIIINILLGLVIIYYSSSKFKKGDLSLLVTFYQISILFYILSIATFMFDRIGVYFRVFEIIIVPLLIQNIERRELRILLKIALIIYLALTLFKTLIIDPDAAIMRYKSILEFFN